MGRGLSVAIVCAWAALVLPAPAQALVPEFFTYTGSEQTFTVPDGVHKLVVAAAGGRGGSTTDAAGGKGAVVGAFVAVTPGATLYVEVGGNGKSQLDPDEPGAGGFNGGGTAGVGP